MQQELKKYRMGSRVKGVRALEALEVLFYGKVCTACDIMYICIVKKNIYAVQIHSPPPLLFRTLHIYTHSTYRKMLDPATIIYSCFSAYGMADEETKAYHVLFYRDSRGTSQAVSQRLEGSEEGDNLPIYGEYLRSHPS